MPLRNKKRLDVTCIHNEDKAEIANVRLLEETLSDGSKVYNVEIAFYGQEVDAKVEYEDSTATNEMEGYKLYNGWVQALSFFKNVELL